MWHISSVRKYWQGDFRCIQRKNTSVFLDATDQPLTIFFHYDSSWRSAMNITARVKIQGWKFEVRRVMRQRDALPTTLFNTASEGPTKPGSSRPWPLRTTSSFLAETITEGSRHLGIQITWSARERKECSKL